MKTRCLPALLVLCLTQIVSAQGENPIRKAKVGDWVNYKMTVAVGDFTVPGRMRMTISAKDEKNATMTLDIDVLNRKESKETKIDLTQAYDPTNLAGLGSGVPDGVKIAKAGDGKETITVGGKKYVCTWTTVKMSGDVGGMKVDGEVKIWMSREIPLAGLVKMDTKMKTDIGVVGLIAEVSDSGSK